MRVVNILKTPVEKIIAPFQGYVALFFCRCCPSLTYKALSGLCGLIFFVDGRCPSLTYNALSGLHFVLYQWTMDILNLNRYYSKIISELRTFQN